MAISTVDKGVFIEVNESFLNAFGYTRKEVIEKSVFDLNIWATPQERTFMVNILKENISLYNYEAEFLKKDGEKRIGLLSLELIPYEGIDCILISASDITSQKKADAKVHENFFFLQQLLDSIPNPIFYKNIEGKYIGFNIAFEKFCGFSKDEIIGKLTHQIMELKAADEFLKMDDIVLNAKSPITIKIKIPYYNISEIDIMVSKAPYYNINNELSGIVGVISDITERETIKRALSLSEEKYKNLIEDISDVVYEANLEGVFIYISPAIETILGFKPDEVTGKVVNDFIFPEDLSIGIAYFQDAISGIPNNVQIRCVKKSGEIIWAQVFISPMIVNGEITGVRGVLTDISELKRIQEGLLSSQRRLMDIIEFLPDPTFVIDKDKKVVAWNHALEEMTGYKKGQMIGKGSFEYALPFYGIRRPVLIDYITGDSLDHQALNQYNNIQWDKNTLVAEAFIQKFNNGKGIYLLAKASPLYDVDGNIAGGIEALRDITDRKIAEIALIESERKFRSIVEQSADGIALCNEKGFVLEWNKSAEEITGLPRNTVLGRLLLDFHEKLIKHDDKTAIKIEKIKNDLTKYFNTGKAPWINKLIEHEIITTDNQIKKIQTILFPIKTSFGFMSCAITRDITKLRDTEQKAEIQQQQLVQASKMSALGILVSGVAHEINNPNQYIMTNITILNNLWKTIEPIIEKYVMENEDFSIMNTSYENIREKIPSLFSGIHEGSDRIKYIVQELRDFARKESSVLNEDVDMNEVVKSSGILVANMIKKSTDNFFSNLDENIPKIKGNYRRLEQVVINLVQNSCQALKDKSKMISIETAFNKINNTVILKISDEGEGISKDNLNHITDPFFTTKRDTGGTGLGLSISSTIITEHGGTMVFDSTPQIGTVVTITLPVKGYIEKRKKNIES